MKTQYKKFGAISLIAFILGSIITYTIAQSENTFIISQGVYPRANYTIWKEGSTYYAKNDYGAIDYSGTNPATIIQNAQNSIPVANGGVIFIKEGQYSIPNTINLTRRGLTIIGVKGIDEGGLWSEDRAYVGTNLKRTTDKPIFNIQNWTITIENIAFLGSMNHISYLITCNSPYGDLHFYNTEFANNGGGGIDLNGSFFVTIKRIRGNHICDYLIRNNSTTNIHTENYIEDITAVSCYILNLRNGFADTIRSLGTDSFNYFAGNITTYDKIIRIEDIKEITLENLNFEGSVSGAPIDMIQITNSNVVLQTINLIETGHATYNAFPIRLLGNTNATFNNVYFSSTKSTVDVALEDTTRFWIINVKKDKGFQKLCENWGNIVAVGGNDYWVKHYLVATPNYISLTIEESDANYFLQIKAKNSSHFQIYLYDNTAGMLETSDKIIHWFATVHNT